MEGILLKESESDDTGNLQRQFLIIRKNVASNQFYDLHQRTFLVEDRHDLISVCYKFR